MFSVYFPGWGVGAVGPWVPLPFWLLCVKHRSSLWSGLDTIRLKNDTHRRQHTHPPALYTWQRDLGFAVCRVIIYTLRSSLFTARCQRAVQKKPQPPTAQNLCHVSVGVYSVSRRNIPDFRTAHGRGVHSVQVKQGDTEAIYISDMSVFLG